MNVNKSISEEIRKNIESDTFTDDLFKDLTGVLITNLSDSYCRVIFTRDFQIYHQNKKFQKESLQI